ncbi:hypothetical protein [Phaffia rhodozyma]|uniref:Uncharacterized protein n=1 Tax=Phaffia rhodozyma TaxID=264483 RepID=A0A0F7STS2_PHARH|nr:hypothetical protein [Phaffia rhodozyma]
MSFPTSTSIDLPLSLDPREPPSTPSPHKIRTPKRTTPLPSRTSSPHPVGHHTLSSSPLNRSASISSGTAKVGSIGGISRDEEKGSDIFERDIEGRGGEIVSLATGELDDSSGPLVHVGPNSPRPHHHHHHHQQQQHHQRQQQSHHVPTPRISATDQLFPTVLDDAIEALSAVGNQDVLVVTPSRSPSRAGSPGGMDRLRRGLGLGSSPDGTGSGSKSPVLSLGEGGRELWDLKMADQSALGEEFLSTSSSPSPPHSLPASPHPLSLSSSSHSLHQAFNSIALPPSYIPTSSNPHSSPHRLAFISPLDLRLSPPLSTHSLATLTAGSSLIHLGDRESITASASASTPSSREPSAVGEREASGRNLEDRLEKVHVVDS